MDKIEITSLVNLKTIKRGLIDLGWMPPETAKRLLEQVSNPPIVLKHSDKEFEDEMYDEIGKLKQWIKDLEDQISNLSYIRE